jgi:hypothetical protein
MKRSFPFCCQSIEEVIKSARKNVYMCIYIYVCVLFRAFSSMTHQKQTEEWGVRERIVKVKKQITSIDSFDY